MQTRSRTGVETIPKAAGTGEVGYADLAERAGSTGASIYRLFAGKADIITALVEELRGRILAFAGEFDAEPAARDRHAFVARLAEGIAKIEANPSARELRHTLIARVDRSLWAARRGGMNATAEPRDGSPKTLIRRRSAGMIPFVSLKKWNEA